MSTNPGKRQKKKSSEIAKLTGRKRKRGKKHFAGIREESGETFATNNTIPPIRNNRFIERFERNHISVIQISSSLSDKKEKFIKINNSTSNNEKRRHKKEKEINIKLGSFPNNQSKKKKRRKRRSKRRKKYFFKKENVKRGNLIQANSLNPNLKKIKVINEQEVDKKIEAVRQELNKRITAQDLKIIAQENKIIVQNKKIKNLNNKIALLSAINQQSEIYSSKLSDYTLKLGTGFNKLINSFKVLYIRKICNFVLDGLINKYTNSLALTEDTFINSRDYEFKLMVFRNSINGISFFKLNLIIDFLMETKNNSSAIIHINKDDIPVMKELFFVFFNKEHNGDERGNNQFVINIKEMTDLILSNNDAKLILQSDESDDKNEEEEDEQKEEDEQEEEDEQKEEDEQEEDEQGEENEKEEEIEKGEKEIVNVDDELGYYEKNIKENDNIKKLLSNKNDNNISIKVLREALEKKILNNQEGIIKLDLQYNEIINESYFYNLWVKSFEKEDYKKSEEYEIFIKKRYIQSPIEMKNILITILPDYKINIFSDDPIKFTERIKKKILRY